MAAGLKESTASIKTFILMTAERWSLPRQTSTQDYGMRKEELILCRKEHQGWGPCVDKLVWNSVWGTPGRAEGSDPVEHPVWAKPSLLMWTLIHQRLVHPHNGMPVQNKKRNALYTCNNLDKSQRLYAEWKSQFQSILYNFLYMTLLNRQNYSNGEQFSSC